MRLPFHVSRAMAASDPHRDRPMQEVIDTTNIGCLLAVTSMTIRGPD
jgi:hypothetical protein